MAHNTLRDNLQSEQVKMKRYFYALRPALACLWIIEKQSVPPMEFAHLRVIITNNEVQSTIDELLKSKAIAVEKAMIAPVAVLNQWLSDTLDWCKERIPALLSEKKYPDELNTIFRKYIQP